MWLPRWDTAFGSCPIPTDPFYPGQRQYRGQPVAAPCSQVLLFSATSCVTALCLCRTKGLCTDITRATCAAQIRYLCVGRAQLYFTSSVLCIWGCTTKHWCFQNVMDFESADQPSWARPTLTGIAGVLCVERRVWWMHHKLFCNRWGTRGCDTTLRSNKGKWPS